MIKNILISTVAAIFIIICTFAGAVITNNIFFYFFGGGHYLLVTGAVGAIIGCFTGWFIVLKNMKRLRSLGKNA